MSTSASALNRLSAFNCSRCCNCRLVGCAKWYHRGVPGCIPDFDGRFERATLRTEFDLHLLHSGALERPRPQRLALDLDRGLGTTRHGGHLHHRRRRPRKPAEDVSTKETSDNGNESHHPHGSALSKAASTPTFQIRNFPHGPVVSSLIRNPAPSSRHPATRSLVPTQIAQDSPPVRPSESVQNRTRAIGMENV